MPDPFVDTVSSDLEEQARERADLDWSSPFHTIGKGPTQAAAGNHKHEESVDPVLVNWFHHGAEGWVKYNGIGTMQWVEMDSPSMPGVLYCNGEVWAEWQMAGPQVFEPDALYKYTIRARLDAAATLSFGFQCYDADTPPVVVDRDNGPSLLKPHYAGVNIVAGDAAYIDEARPGEWLAWTGYISEKSNGDAENIPLDNTTAPVEASVLVASGVSQWRPMFYSTGKVWVDAVEVRRLETSVQAPGDIYITNIDASSITTEVITTTDFKMPPSTEGYVLTAVDDAGNSEWQYPPILATEGPPSSNLFAPDQAACKGGWTPANGTLVYNADNSMTVTATITGTASIYAASGTFGVTVGETRTLRAHITAVGRAAYVRLTWKNVGGTTISTVYGNAIAAGASGVSAVTAEAPANTVGADIYVCFTDAGSVGNTVTVREPAFWNGSGPSDAPENPLTINLGTVAERQGCMVTSSLATTTITATTPWTRVPGSKAVQFTLEQPAMVSVRQSIMMRQSASTGTILYTGVGVNDDLGNPMYPDDWASAFANGVAALCQLRSSTGGDTVITGTSLYKRQLPAGTYLVFTRAYLSATDAASVRTVSNCAIDLEIDPSMTYLTGQRP